MGSYPSPLLPGAPRASCFPGQELPLICPSPEDRDLPLGDPAKGEIRLVQNCCWTPLESHRPEDAAGSSMAFTETKQSWQLVSSTPAGQPLFSLQLSSPSCLAGSVCCLQGVRIPTLGSFDTIPERLRVRARELTVQRPVFRLARNLADAHQLTDDKAYLPGELSAYSPGSCQLMEAHVSPQHGQGD